MIEENNSSNTPQRGTWTITELYRQAWRVVKKNKVLWLFGLLASAGTSYSGSYSGSDSSNSTSSPDPSALPQLFNQPNSPQNFNFQNLDTNVLGAATDGLTQTLGQILSQVPVYLYLIIALEILLLIGAGIAIAFVYKAWVTGSLLAGVKDGLNDKLVTIHDAGNQGLRVTGRLIRLMILETLIVIAFVMAALIPLFIGGMLLYLADPLLKVLIGLGLFIVIVLEVMAFVYLIIHLAWSERVMIEGENSAIAAIKRSFQLTKVRKAKTLGLGLVNVILGFLVTFVFMIPFFILMMGGFIAAFANQDLLIGLIPLAILLLLVFIAGSLFLSGFITAFKATVWTGAFNNIKNG